MASAKYVSKLDLLEGQWQVPLLPRQREAEKQFSLQVDDSQVGAGFVLMQEEEQSFNTSEQSLPG